MQNKIYKLQRQEYVKDFIYRGQNEYNEPIVDEVVRYTGDKKNILYYNKDEAFKFNALPEWKSKIVSEYIYEKGHTGNGQHKYDHNGAPVTLIQKIK